MALTKPTKYSLAAIGFLILALLGGYLGAGLRGGGGGDTATTAAAEATWMETIKKNGELRVGVAIAPPMTVRKGDVLGGPNLIPLQNLAEQMGVKLTPVPAEWKNIVAGLQANRYDAAANLDATLERSLSIQFSDPVYEYQGVFVIKGDSPLSNARAIIESGQPVAIAQGSAPGNAVKEAGAKALEVADYTNALQSVQAGRAVAVFTDLPTAESQVQADSAYKIVVPSPKIYEAGAGYGLPNNIDSRSLQSINVAIAASRMSGELERAYQEENYVTIENLGDMQKTA